MAEIVVRVGGRNVSVEVSEGEAEKILRDLLFHPTSLKEAMSEVQVRDEVALEECKEPSAVSSDFLPVPVRQDVEVLIRSQPEYKHSVESIAEHFAHREVSSGEGRAAELWLNSIRNCSKRIRRSIEDSEPGEWKEDVRGRKKTFRFIRREGITLGSSYHQAPLLNDNEVKLQN